MGTCTLESIAGGFLGVFVGLLIGLSASPVAGLVLGSLITFAVAWLSLKEPSAADPQLRGRAAWRLMFFAIAITCSTVIGLCARTHRWLSPSWGELKQSLVDIGVEPERASEIVAGLLVEEATSADSALGSFLFSSKSEGAVAAQPGKPRSQELELRSAEYLNDDGTYDYENWSAQFKFAGDPWSLLARKLDGASEAEQLDAMKALDALFAPETP